MNGSRIQNPPHPKLRPNDEPETTSRRDAPTPFLNSAQIHTGTINHLIRSALAVVVGVIPVTQSNRKHPGGWPLANYDAAGAIRDLTIGAPRARFTSDVYREARTDIDQCWRGISVLRLSRID